MRFHAHADLRELMDTAQWQDTMAIVHSALERESQELRRDENLAMLLDRWNFFLDAEYAQWTTDPNDENVKAEAKRRRDEGIEPPPKPLLFPIALRREEITEIYTKRYAELAEQYSQPRKRQMTLAQVLARRKR